MCGINPFKAIKKVASVALPIAGSFFGGPVGGALGGALGGELAGGGLKGALIGGALGGLGGTLSGAQGTLTDGTWMGDLNNSWLNSGLGSSISGVGTDIGNFFNGAPAAGSTGANGITSTAFKSGSGLGSDNLSGISTSSSPAADYFTKSGISLSPTPSVLASATAPTKTVFGGLTDALTKDPFGALAAGASIYSNVDQQQKQADLLKDQAAQNQAYNNQMIAALNTPVTPRVQMPVDLTNYGHSGTGEGTFFNDPIQKYAEGGMIDSSKIPHKGLGGRIRNLVQQSGIANAAMHAPTSQVSPVPVNSYVPLSQGQTANYGVNGGEHNFFAPMGPSGPNGYAKGGQVKNSGMIPTQQFQSPLSGMVSGAGGGQDDQVPIMAADGEHVVPSDVVSMLGDGSSKQGSNKLRNLEQNVRKAKGVKNVKTIPKKIKANLKAYTE